MKALLAGVAAIAILAHPGRGQIMRGTSEVPTDTVRRGVFFELGGPGELYSLNYQHHLSPRTIAQIGFSRWSFHFLSPRHASRAGILTVFRQLSAPDLFSEYAFGEFGGGVVAGRHLREDYDPLGDPMPGQSPPLVITRSPWLALSGLVGMRFQPINGGLTYRVGWTPLLVLRDFPGEKRWAQSAFGMSIGFTW